MMEWSDKCPKCNINLVYDRDESTITWTCPICGWGLATTYTPPIRQDTKIYTIYILQNLSPKLDQLKTLSRILAVNYIEVKKILSFKEFVLFEGKAIDVQSVKTQLENAEIEFRIVPDFNYSKSGEIL